MAEGDIEFNKLEDHKDIIELSPLDHNHFELIDANH